MRDTIINTYTTKLAFHAFIKYWDAEKILIHHILGKLSREGEFAYQALLALAED